MKSSFKFSARLVSTILLAAASGCGAEQTPATSTLQSSTATGTLWEADTSRCTLVQSSTGPRYHLCSGNVQGSYDAGVSPSDDPAVRQLAYFTYARLSFTCEALDINPSNVKWQIGGLSGTLAPAATAKIEGDFTVQYESTPLSVTYAPKGTTVFKPGCRLALEQNFKYPDPKIARFYAKLLKGQQEALDETLVAMSANSDTATVISAISNGIDTINETLADYGEDLDPDTVSDLKKAVTELTTAKSKVSGGCSLGGAACDQEKASAQAVVRRHIGDGNARIQRLADFLSAEVTRLNAINQAIAEKLAAALRVIRN